MKLSRVLFILATALGAASAQLLTSCARPSGAPAAEGNTPWVIEADVKEASELVTRAKLTCLDASDCPENVALMIAVTAKDDKKVTFQQCTSFLVADDIVATNSHCIPKKIRQAGAKCSGQIAFVFASKTGERLRADCGEVLSATKIEENPKNADYLRKVDVAFLKLTSKIGNAAPFKIDRRGLPDGMRLKTFVIDPVKQGRIEGALKAQDCSTVQATFANPSYVTPYAGVATASGCEVRTGNSGAPAIDDEGAVRGLIFGVLPTLETATDFNGYETPGQFQAISYLSNAACIETPAGVSVSGPKQDEKACDTRLSQASLRDRARMNAGFDLDSVFSAWQKTAPPLFGYKLVEVKNSGANNAFTGTSLPGLACIKIPSTWPSEKALNQKFERFEKNGSVVTAVLSVPIWAGTYSLDELYRVSIRAKSVDSATIATKFDLEGFSAGGPVKVEFAVKSNDGSIKTKMTNANLKKCEGAE